MADKKISQLTASTTPLAGTEVLPIVQSGTTKKVAVSDLTAGRAISATQVTVSTGSVVIGTSGQGIDFSATAGTGTSELLNDYEEGFWTPVDVSGAGLTFTVTSATYTKIGCLVYVQAFISYPVTANGAAAVIGGLPFTVRLDGYAPFPTECGTVAAVAAGPHLRARTASTVADFLTQTFAQVTNVTLSGQTVIFAGVYST